MKKVYAFIISLASLVSVTAAPCNMSLNVVYKSALCYGTTRDTASVVVINGRAPYSYLWDNSDTDSTDVRGAGPFSVTVTNANSCTATVEDSVLEDPQISNTNILSLHSFCTDSGYAKIQIDGKGGIGKLTYTIQGVGQNTSGAFDSLGSGTYLFVVSDSLGCTMKDEVLVPTKAVDDSFEVSVDSVSCLGSNDGKIIVTPLNPISIPYYYYYRLDTGLLQQDSIFNNLASGVYEVQAYKNVCPFDTFITVPYSGQICTGIIEVDKQPALNIYPNPANTFLTIEYGEVVSGRESYKLELGNELGQIVLSNKPETGNVGKIDVSALPDGLYIVLLKRDNGILSVSKFIKNR